MVGFDRGADDMRVFRADRIEDDIETGAAGAFEVPADFRADTYLEDRPWDYGEGRATDVVVRVDAGYEVGLLPGGRARTPRSSTRPTAPRSSRSARSSSAAVVNFVLGFLDHVQIVEPPEPRRAPRSSLSRSRLDSMHR